MKQVFGIRRQAAMWSAVVTVAAFAGVGSAIAAPVRGTIKAPPKVVRSEQLGFTRAKVAGASERLAAQTLDVALFLKVEESLPIPKPEAPTKVVVRGLQLVPDVFSCAVDAVVEFVNEEPTPITLKLDDVELKLGAGESRSHECAVGKPQRTVRIAEWPHVRGLLFVGEVGVAGAPNARGGFTLTAPNGKYQLQVLSRDGVVTTRPVEVAGASVNVGVIDLAAPADGAEAP